MIERGEILEELKDRLKTVSGVALVTRNWRKSATTTARPAIFIVDRQDTVQKTMARPSPEFQREWLISVVAVISGTSAESAPSEMDDFIKLVKKAIYVDQRRDIGTHSVLIEHSMSQLVFPPTGKNTVARELVFSITYREQIAALWD